MTDREELLNDLDEMLILQSPSLELMSKASEMIEELSAKLDKAREALNMASWNQIGGYEGQQKWLELNRELDK